MPNLQSNSIYGMKLPMIQKLQRADHFISGFGTNVGGFVQLTIYGADYTTYYEAGNTIVFYAGSSVDGLWVTTTVTSSAFVGGDTTILTGLAWESRFGETGTLINNMSKKPDYRMEVAIEDNSGNLLLDKIYLRYPTMPPYRYLDFSPYLKTLVIAKWDSVNSNTGGSAETNNAYGGMFLKWKYKYRDLYTGTVGSWSALSATHYAVMAQPDMVNRFNNYGTLEQFIKGLGYEDYHVTENILGTGSLNPFFNFSAGQTDWVYDNVTGQAKGSSLTNWLTLNLPSTMIRTPTGMKTDSGTYLKIRYFGSHPNPSNIFAIQLRNSVTTNTQTLSNSGYYDAVEDTANGEYDQVMIRCSTYDSGDFYISRVEITIGDEVHLFSPLYGELKAWLNYPVMFDTLHFDLSTNVTAYLLDADKNVLYTHNLQGGSYNLYHHTINYADMQDERIKYLRIYTGGTTKLIEIPVEVPCKNPIYVMANSRLGGRVGWLFENKQEYTITNSNGKQVRRLKLFAERLTLGQWEGLNNLFSNDIIYDQSPYARVTSGGAGWEGLRIQDTRTVITFKPHPTNVYANEYWDCVIIEASNTTDTSQEIHSFEMTVETALE